MMKNEVQERIEEERKKKEKELREDAIHFGSAEDREKVIKMAEELKKLPEKEEKEILIFLEELDDFLVELGQCEEDFLFASFPFEMMTKLIQILPKDTEEHYFEKAYYPLNFLNFLLKKEDNIKWLEQEEDYYFNMLIEKMNFLTGSSYRYEEHIDGIVSSLNKQ